jgi:hypothetical protein
MKTHQLDMDQQGMRALQCGAQKYRKHSWTNAIATYVPECGFSFIHVLDYHIALQDYIRKTCVSIWTKDTLRVNQIGLCFRVNPFRNAEYCPQSCMKWYLECVQHLFQPYVISESPRMASLSRVVCNIVEKCAED